MLSALHLSPHGAPAIHAMALACGLALFTLSGYAQATEVVGARASASKTSAVGPDTGDDEGIRPFHIDVPEAQLDDLRKRIAATRWPDKETVSDESQGIRLAEVQELVHYWGNGYNWRNVEAKLNALPEFVTTIDGVDIQFKCKRQSPGLSQSIPTSLPSRRARTGVARSRRWPPSRLTRPVRRS